MSKLEELAMQLPGLTFVMTGGGVSVTLSPLLMIPGNFSEISINFEYQLFHRIRWSEDRSWQLEVLVWWQLPRCWNLTQRHFVIQKLGSRHLMGWELCTLGGCQWYCCQVTTWQWHLSSLHSKQQRVTLTRLSSLYPRQLSMHCQDFQVHNLIFSEFM